MSDALIPYINRIIDLIVNPFVMLLFFISFIIFAWGILVMITNADKDDKRAQGRSHMIWGIIGMLIVIAAYGIFGILENTVWSIA